MNLIKSIKNNKIINKKYLQRNGETLGLNSADWRCGNERDGGECFFAKTQYFTLHLLFYQFFQ